MKSYINPKKYINCVCTFLLAFVLLAPNLHSTPTADIFLLKKQKIIYSQQQNKNKNSSYEQQLNRPFEIFDPKFDWQPKIFRLREVAAQMKPKFDKQIKSLAQKLNCQFVLAPIKELERCQEKIYFDYKGDINKLTDLVRASLVFDDLQSLYRSLAVIKNNFQVLNIKNRFSNSQNSYKDINITVLMDNYLKAEIQLHLPEILGAKKIETPIYQTLRKLINQLTQNLDSNKNQQLQNQINYLIQAREKIYFQAWQQYILRIKNSWP